MTRVDGEGWIIKFPSSVDPPDIGKDEYELALLAKQCGVNMPEVSENMPIGECEDLSARIAQAKLYEEVEAGEDDVREGRYRSAESVVASLRETIGL